MNWNIRYMKILLFISLLVISSLAYSQESIVNNGSLPEAEIHAAINPLNANNMVIASQNGFGNLSGGHNIIIYYTKDFGATWQKSNFNGVPVNHQNAGDPVLSFDHQGNVFLVNLATSSADINTVLSKSTDGGATWSLVSMVATANTDKPWVAIDRCNSSAHKGNIYIPLVGNNVITYTLNSNYQKTDSITITNGVQLPSVVVNKNGTVYTSTVELTPNNVIYVQKYANGGASLVHSTQVVSFPDKTFNAPDVSLRYQPTAYLAVDNSTGPRSGRLYLSYTASETNNQSYFDIFITYSDDEGLTWSTPKVVNSVQQNQIQQFYSSIYVNDNGVLLIDWYDRKNYNNSNKLTDFYLGISYDGANTFTEVKLNSISSDFENVIPASNNFGIGEYHQLVATNNTAISFWSDGRTNNGDLNIYMAKVNLNSPTTVQELSIVSDAISISDIFPLPAQNCAYTNMKLSKTTKLKYEIINTQGQKINESEWKEYPSGNHKLIINTDLPAGTYFINFSTNNGYFKNQKLIKF